MRILNNWRCFDTSSKTTTEIQVIRVLIIKICILIILQIFLLKVIAICSLFINVGHLKTKFLVIIIVVWIVLRIKNRSYLFNFWLIRLLLYLLLLLLWVLILLLLLLLLNLKLLLKLILKIYLLEGLLNCCTSKIISVSSSRTYLLVFVNNFFY